MIMYGDNDNPSYNNGPRDFDYCRFHNNLDFRLYHSLMSILYRNCDKNKLEYNACQYQWKVFNAGIMLISIKLMFVFTTHL